MEEKYMACSIHGKQEMALLCTHLAHSLHNRLAVGFFEYDTGDMGRPDAWCNTCERAWNHTQTEEDREQWFIDCQHKLICVSCWDEAKALNQIATEIHFKLLTIAEIKTVLLEDDAGVPFPKNIAFPFPSLYPLFAKRAETTTISSETTLFNTVEALSENKTNNGSTHWIFARNGQGDRWLFDEKGHVFFGDHDHQPMSLHPLYLNFEQWLQLAFCVQQLDDWLDAGYPPERIAISFNETLNTIHPQLAENYPFELI
ncbi:SMI1/KNR4 family protein [Myroides sp. NP-2]|uniref:SMI1/KNR4 family protein n=1 Tax=Myroides sp. NP-2 TaxID=2759945 RepID=UPI0015FD8969|nr:SMI1/KNR4 family protein [Myroides sp. NP-2]MBB1150158.1 SMI1/KNR4 family protein [Myroides sp. NP-2]